MKKSSVAELGAVRGDAAARISSKPRRELPADRPPSRRDGLTTLGYNLTLYLRDKQFLGPILRSGANRLPLSYWRSVTLEDLASPPCPGGAFFSFEALRFLRPFGFPGVSGDRISAELHAGELRIVHRPPIVNPAARTRGQSPVRNFPQVGQPHDGAGLRDQ